MARYIDADKMQDFLAETNGIDDWCVSNYNADWISSFIESQPTADVVEVKHGKWQIEVHSFYADNFSEDTELVIYALAKCSCCGKVHNPHQVYSEHLYAPEDASYDFRFDQEYEKAKSLEKFKQRKYEFQNYCPHCGAKMDLKENKKCLRC